jgi:hypothetical protein
MNKAELLAALAAKFSLVGQVTSEGTDGTINKYKVQVYETGIGGSNNIRSRFVGFLVRDEGTAQESAFWATDEPNPTVLPSAFANDVRALASSRIGTLVGGGTLNSFDFEYIDADNQRAVVWLITDSAGVKSERKALIERNAGNWSFSTIPTPVRTGVR